ncbi:hypothetical protein B0H21DRAFT_738596 [Amylocystis lapponica]|nr:hypothetical protein B0H21DRAFT_738596 [Amylocystis lapponica]
MAERPAWQTDELVDEWIDQDDDDDLAVSSAYAHSSSDISFTQPIGSVLVRNADLENITGEAGGTFLVREDVPAAPILPKTPGRNKKTFTNDFFSPLALERMFEPPSPPATNSTPLPPVQTTAPIVPSRLSQVYIPGQETSEQADSSVGSGWEDRNGESGVPEPAAGATDTDRASLNCQFTFEVPRRPSPFNPMGSAPEAQSTPGPPHAGPSMLNPPTTDPRLRLFQFQYDTFTRDHLSAMVDSIAVNTPSGGSGAQGQSGESSPTGLSPVREASLSRLRSSKRIKLSPASDYSGDGGDGAAVIIRPLSMRRDYVGESKSLMEKIRKARDFSTVSTVASAQQSPVVDVKNPTPQERRVSTSSRRPSFLNVPGPDAGQPPSSNGTTTSSKRSTYSSVAYREQAANLMAQIRDDMKGSKRLFSGDTEVSQGLLSEDRGDSSLMHTSAVEHNTLTSGDSHGGKENIPQVSHSRKSSSSSAARARHKASPRKASPRKLTRRVNVVEVNRDLTDDFTQMSLDNEMLEQFPPPPVTVTVASVVVQPASISIPNPAPNPTLLAPPAGNAPAYPSSSIRSGRNEDLTRFVSSSTASGTTVTVASAASFVKHPGPKQIMRITPEDVPALPDRVGKMVFDKVMMRWVKATAMATGGIDEEAEGDIPGPEPENESEDPFRDIESLHEEEQDDGQDGATERRGEEEDGPYVELEKSRIEDIDTESELEDEEEAELTSFSFDSPSAELVQVMNGNDQGDDMDDTDTDDEPDQDATDTTGPSFEMAASDYTDDDDQVQPSNQPRFEAAFPDSPPHLLAPPTSAVLSTPHPPARGTLGAMPTPVIRSALKSNSITPTSVMKTPYGSQNRTPANRLGHRRSVSFSDGKRDGPIMGIGRNIPTPDGSAEDNSPLAGGSNRSNAVLVPSARSKRIADMLENLEDPTFAHDSPSKTSSTGRPPADELHPMKPRRPSSTAANVGSPSREISRRVFSRSLASKSPNGPNRNANATFLTECSFGVAHDRLVQVITDVQPFEPYWEELTTIDLSKRNIDSIARLKEFLPRLDSLSVNGNQLSWLSGVPGTVRSLCAASNALTSVTSYSHLLNLEHLDISRNQIDSLRQLECLRHLRELRADSNKIDSTDGLEKMDGLVKLSLQGNSLRSVDLRHVHWTRMEMLNLSQNRLTSVAGLAALPALIALNLDNNTLSDLVPEGAMPRLRILRVSVNKLQHLDVSPFPSLRTLYADNNALGTISKAHRLVKLENLSLRNQSGRNGLTLSIRDVRDVKRLYLSGNPLPAHFLSEPCYNLIYLEAAACRLTALPADLAHLAPNLRVLNLNYNFLTDARALGGLARLRKLTLIGSRVARTAQLVRVLRGMRDLEMLDFRMNPCTLGWYLPLLVKDVPGALQPSDAADAAQRAPAEGAWRELDAKFRRDLPDAAYAGRLAYRGLVMRACPRMRMLDGIEVSGKERDKAERLLRGVLGAAAQPPGER